MYRVVFGVCVCVWFTLLGLLLVIVLLCCGCLEVDFCLFVVVLVTLFAI